MSRLERIYYIHERFRNARHPVSKKQLTDHLEISINTLTRDFEFMRDTLGAPIEYVHEYKGHRYNPDAPVFELPGLWMNASELHALLACEQLLESVQPGLMTPRLAPLKNRIRELLKDAGHDAEQVSDRVRVQPIAMRSVPQHIFEPVAEATLGNKILSIVYHGRQRNDTTERQVHPQRLLHYRQNWYLLAWCEQAEDLRLFSLERIAKPTITQNRWKPVDDQALDRFTNDGFGIFSGRAVDTAHLLFSAKAARWVAEETWHPEQQGQWDNDGYHLHVPYSDPTELIMDILRHGPEVEVLGPESLHQAIKETVQQMGKNYCTNGP